MPIGKSDTNVVPNQHRSDINWHGICSGKIGSLGKCGKLGGLGKLGNLGNFYPLKKY